MRVGEVGNFCDHVAGVGEVYAAGVADGYVQGAENQLSAADVDGAADQGVDDFHDGGLDGVFILEESYGMKTRVGAFDRGDHALVEVAEGLSAESG